jgi:hypothetical protein
MNITVLQFKADSELDSKVKPIESLRVDPNNSKNITTDFTINEVTNESITNEGSFLAKIK